MKIQVVGLPGAGKTTGINQFFDEYQVSNVKHIDIRDFQGPYRERKFKQAIQNEALNLIAESACGVWNSNTTVIHLQTPIEDVYKNLQIRGSNIDSNYLNLLAGQITYSDYRIETVTELPSLLNFLLQ